MRLTIDTACEACSAGLFEGSALIAQQLAHPGTGHAERLPFQLEALWRDYGQADAALDSIVVTIGPGSFTGLRVGLSAAKAVALATGASLIGVTSLAALAGSVATSGLKPPDRLLTAIDARRGQAYVQEWQWLDGRYQPACEAAVVALASLAGDGLTAQVGTAIPAIGRQPFGAICYATPAGLNGAAASGELLDLWAAPLYLRPHDAVAAGGPQ